MNGEIKQEVAEEEEAEGKEEGEEEGATNTRVLIKQHLCRGYLAGVSFLFLHYYSSFSNNSVREK